MDSQLMPKTPGIVTATRLVLKRCQLTVVFFSRCSTCDFKYTETLLPFILPILTPSEVLY